MRFTLFFVIITVLSLFASYYLHRRYIASREFKRPILKWLATALLLLGVVTLFGARLVVQSERIALRALSTMAFFWITLSVMGFLAVLLFYTIAYDLVTVLPLRLMTDPARRRFLTRTGREGVLVAAAVTAGAGIIQAVRGPELVQVEVAIRDLPPGLDGFKIVQLSDLHVGPTIDRAYVERVVAMANAQGADLAALTGDFVDGSVPRLRADVAPLATIQSRHGSFFCTGNHEYFSGVEEWSGEFSRMGFKVLRNQHAMVTHQGVKLLVAGVHDLSSGRFDPLQKEQPGRFTPGCAAL